MSRLGRRPAFVGGEWDCCSPVGSTRSGRFGWAPAVAVLSVAVLTVVACGGGSTAPAAPAAPVVEEPPAAAPSTTSEAPPATAPEPAAPAADATPPSVEPGSAADGEADAVSAETDGAAPAGVAGDDPSASRDADGTPPPAGLSAAMEARLHALLDELAGIAGAWSPAGRAALAVVPPDGTLYGFNEHRQHISASAVKPLWAAAAVDLAGLDAVVPLAEAALVRSDNHAAGRLIDLIGIDAINDWSSNVAGSTGTHLAAWFYGVDRVAESVVAGGTRANLTTAADLAVFFARLRRGELLDPEGAGALEGWLRATPRGSTVRGAVNGALLARLPPDVAAAAVHKTGWLPPYCCRAEVRLVIDAGIVPLPGDGWFAIGAVSDRGEAYNLSVEWLSLAACRVYVLLAGDNAHTCEIAGDGTPRPELWPPPPEPEPEEADAAETPGDAEDAEPLDDAEPTEDDKQDDQPTPDADPASDDGAEPASETPAGSESMADDETQPTSEGEE